MLLAVAWKTHLNVCMCVYSWYELEARSDATVRCGAVLTGCSLAKRAGVKNISSEFRFFFRERFSCRDYHLSRARDETRRDATLCDAVNVSDLYFMFCCSYT